MAARVVQVSDLVTQATDPEEKVLNHNQKVDNLSDPPSSNKSTDLELSDGVAVQQDLPRQSWLGCWCCQLSSRPEQRQPSLHRSESPALDSEVSSSPVTASFEAARPESARPEVKPASSVGTSSSSSGSATGSASLQRQHAPLRVPTAPLLPPQAAIHHGRKTLVLDLDETLVHSSFRKQAKADFALDIDLGGDIFKVYVAKRPGVDDFLANVAKQFEVVVFTASTGYYADPLLDCLDPHRVIAHRLFREACTQYPEGYVKDLARLGRDLKDVIIVDNSPLCYALQPENAVPVRTWRNDPHDRDLEELLVILEHLAGAASIPEIVGQITWADEG